MLYLVNAGFKHFLAYDLETHSSARHSLPNLLGEHYTLVWLEEDHALSIGPKSWKLRLSQREMDRIWTTDPVLHFAFGAGLRLHERVYLVGGVQTCQDDFDSDQEMTVDLHASYYTGIVEVELHTLKRHLYRGVLPKPLIQPAVVWLETEAAVLIFGGKESLEQDNPVVNMDAYIYSPRARRAHVSGRIPGIPSLIQCHQISGSHVYAVFASGEVLDCDLNTGLALRFWPELWNQRKSVLWTMTHTHTRLPIGLIRVITCDFLAIKPVSPQTNFL